MFDEDDWYDLERTLELFYARRERERIEEANRKRAAELVRRVIEANTYPRPLRAGEEG